MVDQLNKKTPKKLPKLVGSYIRKKREALGLSQRSLGLLFSPAVTTQFISNVERGITPLPPNHVPTLARALRIPESELMEVLEKEYATRLSNKLGKEGLPNLPQSALIQALSQAYSAATPETKRAFRNACKAVFPYLDIPQE